MAVKLENALMALKIRIVFYVGKFFANSGVF